jgi:hypothetical protein
MSPTAVFRSRLPPVQAARVPLCEYQRWCGSGFVPQLPRDP